MLGKDLKNVLKFFTENELIKNLKGSKTESMLLGTSQKLSTDRNQIQLFFKSTAINVVKPYKYLVAIVNPNLNLGEQFDKTYKKMSTKLKLLGKLKCNLTSEATKIIILSPTQPSMKYNCLTHLKFTNTQKENENTQ